ncbi:MAG: thioredoxin domain-containing protein [Rhodanobacteraceae bacterium]|nr:MAG: thioredoxin domain-containing protein [Rhodanobacteraceae bacterium]
MTSNRLAHASSPYLRQHAGNPVHWQPWDDDTLAYAKETDTPILLSIGYSACHWCHVMAHECFENPAIAEAMNAGFVNIKLDREERPDIDRVYQLAHQALSARGGGWPLTAFLDPQDLAPFYIGTYFPPTPRHGLPGFPEVLHRVRAFFDQHRGELRAQAERLRGWLQHADGATSDASIDANAANRSALQRIGSRFDPDWGGNMGAPKFPRATELEWLLDRQMPHGNARNMAQLTLARMATRGLQDHLSGGFFRYCVDADWTIPHFEKMLYDNAQLLPVYARLAANPQTSPALRDTATAAAQGIVDWLARDMTAPGGAFYSSLDADSEHEEGRFYLWTRAGMRTALDAADILLAEAAYGLDAPPNFEGRAWHLLRDTPLDALATRFVDSPGTVATHLAAIRQRLFEARARRIPPARDDKILTAWNALAISGLARAAWLLDDARCAMLARRALTALRDSIWIDGALYANAAEPVSRIPGFLDDHAFLLDALLEALQLEFRRDDLDWATALADALCGKFSDAEAGGFWFSTTQHATPLARSRNWTDDALPNGNAVAIRSLLRLGHLVGNTHWLDTAERALHAAADALAHHPDACPTLLRALDESEKPRTQIVVRSPPAQCDRWRTALRDGLRDAGTVPGHDRIDAFLIPATDALPGLLSERASRNDNGTAWVCSGLTCQAPLMSAEALREALRAVTAG